jgi:para-aminobenzoate synthetase/4-amino-4-deoxychorismate lyase
LNDLDLPLHDAPLAAADRLDPCFALCDDSDPSHAEARSRLYTGYLATLTCRDAADLPRLLEQMQDALHQGQFAVGLFAYELGAAMQDAVAVRPESTFNTSSTPVMPTPFLAEALLFAHCQILDAAQVDAWLAARCDAAPAGIAQMQPSVNAAQFETALAQIHAYIEAGDTYQVNYTYRLHFDAFGSICALYRRLRQRQPVPYGALVALPDGRAVLSLSPELFVRHSQGELTARPMKGTAAASGEAQEDALRAAALAADPKNRAENVMIVDLLRNDLGRIASVGSVQVSALFEVKRFSSVLQMTSTVLARLRPGLHLADIFNALYPCGSITGAPKRRTMQIIRELESAPRGLYTGAIGWFDAPMADGADHTQPGQPRGIGDFCLSVPIRTMMLQAPGQDGVRRGEMGVGAGIVHDSVASDEYAECQLKARFLTGLGHDFQLFETMHASQAEGCRHLARHLQRLDASARYFGFPCDVAALRARVQAVCAAMPPGTQPQRLRLALDHAGQSSLQYAPLSPLTQPVRLLLAAHATDASALFLRHKTTVRAEYDAAWRAAEAQGAFDMLFCNAGGALTEGGRSNVFAKLDGHWYTPTLSDGVLPGVMRAVILADAAWAARERRLTLDDLRSAQQVMVCNALRGPLMAVIDYGY